MNTIASFLSRLITMLCLGVLGAFPALAQEESIVLDPGTGNYIVNYRGFPPEEQMYRVVFVPATKIEPVVKSSFTLTEQRNIRYRYKVTNGRNSKQPLVAFRMRVSNVIESSQLIPEGWRASIIPNFVDARILVNWGYADLKEDDSAGLLPGQSQSGFSIDSPDLPGVDMARLSGATPIFAVFEEGPDPSSEVGKKLNQLEANDFVLRPVAAPLIPVPSPFNAATFLEAIRAHVKTWVEMKLLDPALAMELDQQFQSAITALQSGNTSAARLYLRDLRTLVKKHHADLDQEGEDDQEDKATKKDKPLIDKLAAKVLVFDLKFLLKKLAEERLPPPPPPPPPPDSIPPVLN